MDLQVLVRDGGGLVAQGCRHAAPVAVVSAAEKVTSQIFQVADVDIEWFHFDVGSMRLDFLRAI